MNCRERALAALNHQEPDRVPLDFGGRQTTLHLYAHQALMRHLGLSGPEPLIRSYHTYLVEPDPQLLRRFERVSTIFFPKPPSDYVFKIDPATNSYVDEWGTTYHMPLGRVFLRYDCHPAGRGRDGGGSDEVSLAEPDGPGANRGPAGPDQGGLPGRLRRL